uniref:Uncharacterized protein n=1 Tax=Ciona intestinalis TaxID=7719 RepID=H2Y2Z7_CIOIN
QLTVGIGVATIDKLRDINTKLHLEHCKRRSSRKCSKSQLCVVTKRKSTIIVDTTLVNETNYNHRCSDKGNIRSIIHNVL